MVPGIAEHRSMHDDFRKKYKATKPVDTVAAREGSEPLLRQAPASMVESSPRDQVVQAWMALLRKDFAGYAIRRTIKSTNEKGELISGLPPMLMVVIELVMSLIEFQALNDTAQWSTQKRVNLVSAIC